MKASAISIHWHHENAPIYSAHFQPGNSSNGVNRLATAGGDNNVRIWQVERTDTNTNNKATGLNNINTNGTNNIKNTSDSNETSTSSNINSSSSDNIMNLVHVKYLSTLVKHTQAVNVVRFDPRGSVLASAGDDGTIVLWTLSDTITRTFGDDVAEDKESWRPRHVCRHSVSEIYDLAWSPDSQYVLAGSMDNVARIYNAVNGQCLRELTDHIHYVQGVTWDPLGAFVATQSSDRSVHVYNVTTKDGVLGLKSHHKSARVELPTQNQNLIQNEKSYEDEDQGSEPISIAVTENKDANPNSNSNTNTNPSAQPVPTSPSFVPQTGASSLLVPKASYLYHNETFTSFFRRLSFSPDGSLLLTPSGVYKHHHQASATSAGGASNGNGNTNGSANGSANSHDTPASDDSNTVYIYTRAGLGKPPVAHLPGLKKPSLAVCCSPVLYKLRKSCATAAGDKTKDSDIKNTNGLNGPVFTLPYRVVYAVLTQDSVLVYDTEQQQPLAVISNINYSALTDAAWSPDGQTLFVTSTDGFCSAVLFDNELGEVYHGETKKAALSGLSKASELHLSTSSTIDSKSATTPTSSSPIIKMDTKEQPTVTASHSVAKTSTNKRPASASQPSSPTSTAVPPLSREVVPSASGVPKKKKKRIAPTLVSKPE